MFNKHAFGPKSVQIPFRTTSWKLRMNFALLSMCETNAFLAHNWFASHMGHREWTHSEHKLALAKLLIHNTNLQSMPNVAQCPSRSPSCGMSEQPLTALCAHTMQLSSKGRTVV